MNAPSRPGGAPSSLPNGRLRAALVLPYVLGQAKTGTDQIGVQFRLLDDPWKGWTLPWYGSFTPDAFPATYEALTACGWRGEQIATLKQDLRDNTEVSVIVEPEEFEGRWRARIRWVNPPQSIRMHRVFTKEQRATLAVDIQSMIDRKLHERRRERTKDDPGAPDDDGGDYPDSNDDIPF